MGANRHLIPAGSTAFFSSVRRWQQRATSVQHRLAIEQLLLPIEITATELIAASAREALATYVSLRGSYPYPSAADRLVRPAPRHRVPWLPKDAPLTGPEAGLKSHQRVPAGCNEIFRVEEQWYLAIRFSSDKTATPATIPIPMSASQPL